MPIIALDRAQARDFLRHERKPVLLLTLILTVLLIVAFVIAPIGWLVILVVVAALWIDYAALVCRVRNNTFGSWISDQVRYKHYRKS